MAATREKMQAYVQALVDLQQQRVQDALALIPDEHRHLLAVHGYVRHAARINERWAMTNAEEEAFRSTPAFRTMESESRRSSVDLPPTIHRTAFPPT